MITLNIVYSEAFEVERVKFTLGKMDWYKQNNYTVSIPNGLDELSLEQEIVSAIRDQWEEDDYSNFARSLHEQWDIYEEVIQKMYSLNGFSSLLSGYTVVLTRYGTGGSYFVNEGKIIINCRKERKRNPLGIIMHELTHMGVEHLIERYDVSHWRKERLVDLLGQKYFSEIEDMQNIREDVSLVDKVFQECYPDVEEIAKRIGSTA